MTQEILLALIAFAVVSSITPGPNNLMLMASGANFGWRRTLPHMAGITLGFISLILLVGIGLTQLFALYPLTYVVLKSGAVLFLLYLAYRIATATRIDTGASRRDSKPLKFYQAALFQWVNPKGWAMALSAISAYSPEGSGFSGVAMVAGVFAAVNLPAAGSWVFLGTQLRRFLDVPWKLRTFNITAALLLLGSMYPIISTMA